MAYKITEECISCGACINECPSNCISEGEPYKVNAAECSDCGACANVCPASACVPA